jgi:cytochrome bd-type quinol oxidase subunit 2
MPDQHVGSQSGGARPIGTGPGRLLIAVYAFFALAAGARAGWQVATKFSEAPVAYLLSLLAAVIYLVAAIGLAVGRDIGRRVALVCCSIELVGVLIVGTVSLLMPDTFPRATVWSSYGIGYGFVPLILPVLGLFWLHRTRHPRQ